MGGTARPHAIPGRARPIEDLDDLLRGPRHRVPDRIAHVLAFEALDAGAIARYTRESGRRTVVRLQRLRGQRGSTQRVEGEPQETRPPERDVGREQLASFGTAVTIERISESLRDAGYMLAFTPAIGFATLGGALATGAHGKGTDVLERGGATICSLVVEMQAVAFDPKTERYELRQFGVDDPELPALSLHLGSAIVTRVTLRAVEATLFSASKAFLSLPRYFDIAGGAETLVDDLGQEHPLAVELMWFPYQGRFASRRHLLRRGLQATSKTATLSAEAQQPYREPFNFASRDVDAAFEYALAEGRRRDIGIKFQHLLGFARRDEHLVDAHAARIYVSHFILRLHAAGWCVVIDRSRTPTFLLRFADTVRALQERYAFPLDGPIEVRITDVEPRDGGPALSPAAAPLRADAGSVYAVWLNVLTHLVENAGKLLHELEAFLLAHTRADGVHRVCGEWHKGWAYDAEGTPWRAADRIARFRASFDETSQPWRETQEVLENLDPHALFRSELADRLFEP